MTEEVPPLVGMLEALSRWVDDAPANAARDPEAALWGRVSKIGEEVGEAEEAEVADEVLRVLAKANGRVISTLVGMTGQNPRKGATADATDLCMELAAASVVASLQLRDLEPGDQDTKEVLDVAVTAMGALEHVARLYAPSPQPGDHGWLYVTVVALRDHYDVPGVVEALTEHARFLCDRAGVLTNVPD